MASAPASLRGVTAVERFPSSAGARVLDRARKYLALGVSETSTNSGPYIDEWQQRFGLSGTEWCGMFAGSMYREADVDDDGLAHPAVYRIWERGYQLRLISRIPYPGCFVTHCNLLADGTLDKSKPYSGGRHVDLFERWHNKQAGLAVVIGGNVSNKVTRYIVDVNNPTSGDPTRKSVFIVPKALRVGPKKGW